MKLVFKTLMLCAVTSLLCVSVQAVEQSRLFSVSQLQNNETLEIGYASQGCFHSDKDKFVFSTAGVTSNTIQSASISADDLMKIDNYLNRLLTKKTIGGCTTSTNLNLVLRRNGEVVLKKELVDADCFLSDDEMNFGYLKHNYGKQETANIIATE